MGLDYEYEPPHPEEQHQRLVALRLLTSRGIPCILWAEDALNYVHSVPTMLFDQQVLVPDDLLESASSALVEGPYSAVPFTPEYADYPDESGTDSSFPRGILHLLDPPHYNTKEYASHPLYVLLLPQSYFGFDVQSKERFQSLVPPLPPSNAGILVPKYHTFLEGLRAKHCIFISYLLRYRVKYQDGYGAPMITEVLPEEYVILSELQTEEARWYVGMFIHEHRFPVYADMMAFFRRTRAQALESDPSVIETSPEGSSEASVLGSPVIKAFDKCYPESESSVPGLPALETSCERSQPVSVEDYDLAYSTSSSPVILLDGGNM